MSYQAHTHGYPVDTHEDFGKIIKANLEAQKSLINECHKTHLVTPKEALRQGLKLNSPIVKTTKITWEWDYKRRLLNPNINLWSEYSPTKPWKNLEEVIETLGFYKPRSQKWKTVKPRGKMTSLNQQKITEMLKDREKGLSLRQIASKHGISHEHVRKIIKQYGNCQLSTVCAQTISTNS